MNREWIDPIGTEKQVPRGSRTRWSALFVVVFWLASTATHADVVDHSGTVPVPGMEGSEVQYRVGAARIGSKDTSRKSSFWMEVKNPSDEETIRFVICAMHSLKDAPDNDVPEVDYDDFGVDKDGDVWDCDDTPDLRLGDNGPPTFHLGCQRVELGPGEEKSLEDITIDWKTDIKDSNLGKVYIDFLKDCEVTECAQVRGGNKFLFPSAPSNHEDWVNVWGEQSRMQDLTGSGLSIDEWPSGNWVTMGDPLERSFPARIRGELTGAPAGTQVTMRFAADGPSMERRIYTVRQDPHGTECAGLPLAVDELFEIPPTFDDEDLLAFQVPDGPCGLLEEGTVVRFAAEVTAVPGTPIYDAGDRMHSIDSVFVQDTVPPTAISGPISTEAAEGARVEILLSDATVLPAAASLLYTVGDGPLHEEAMEFSPSPQEGPDMSFGLTLPGVAPDDLSSFQVHGCDELGNCALFDPSPDGALCLPDSRTLCLNDQRFQVEVDWRDFEGGTGVGQVVDCTTDDSGLFWFFRPDNWELLVKVIDGCDFNDNFWVFAGSTTNVEYTLRVTDTSTGAVREYHNPLGRSAPAITDTQAFATCSVPGGN